MPAVAVNVILDWVLPESSLQAPGTSESAPLVPMYADSTVS